MPDAKADSLSLVEHAERARAAPHRSVEALFDEFRRLNGAHLSDAFALALTKRLCDELADEGQLEEIAYPSVRVARERA